MGLPHHCLLVYQENIFSANNARFVCGVQGIRYGGILGLVWSTKQWCDQTTRTHDNICLLIKGLSISLFGT